MRDMEPLQLLAAGVPLTLLLDLARQDGPASHRLLSEEHADTSWIAPDFPRSAAGRVVVVD